MMTKNEALKMAIEALEEAEDIIEGKTTQGGYFYKAIQACKEALERPTNMVAVPADQLEKMQQELKQLRKQPAQEPVGWMDSEGRFRLDFKTEIVRSIAAVNKEIPLYTHPAPSWQGLSDDEIAKIIGKGAFYEWNDVEFARAIDKALMEKNT